jgi:hypothetical protein
MNPLGKKGGPLQGQSVQYDLDEGMLTKLEGCLFFF